MKKMLKCLLIITLMVVFPKQVMAAEVESLGTKTVAATASASDYLLEYDYFDNNATGNININIGDGTGSYQFDKNGGSLGIVTTGVYGINSKLETVINGNLIFNRLSSSENEVYGIDAYSLSNIKVNGNYETSQKTTLANNNSVFAYGAVAEASSNLSLLKNTNITKVEASSTNGEVQAMGIGAFTIDGAGGANDGESTLTLGENNNNSITIKNIKAESTNNIASAIALSSSGLSNSTPEKSIATANGSVNIDGVNASGQTDNAYGVSATILGIVNLNGDVSIKNVTATSNNAYSLEADYGGIVNVNQNSNRTVKLEGDLLAINCFSDDSDKAIINLNLTNANSYLKGATVRQDDSSDGIFGAINMNITDNATWEVTNKTDTTLLNNNLSTVDTLNMNNGIIDMHKTNNYQEVNADSSNNFSGNLIIDTDVKNITGANKGDYISIDNSTSGTVTVYAYDKNISSLTNTNYKEWFATTTKNSVSFVPGEVTINGKVYEPIITSDSDISGATKTDWYITGYKEKVSNNVTISFDTTGGNIIPALVVIKNTVVNLDKIPTRDGYTFVGWYTDLTYTSKITSLTATTDTTVYAKWEKKDSPVSPTPSVTNPNTSDKLLPWIIALVGSVVILGALIIVMFREKKQK